MSAKTDAAVVELEQAKRRRAEDVPVLRTDLGNARRFAAEHAGRLRYVVAQRRWLVWTRGRWRTDVDAAVSRAAKSIVDQMVSEAASLEGDERKAALKHAMYSQGDPGIRRMIDLASTEPGIVATPDQFDAEPGLLSCANGTIDLKTGALRPHDPEDLISLGCEVEYDPAATCPRWEEFLAEVFGGDGDVISFIQRAAGYSLTGDTREHVLFILHGTGRNGKTTFLETIRTLLGDLAANAGFDTFLRARGDRGPRHDIARLHRARMVTAIESGKGRRMDEATVKALVGGDTITARFLYRDEFEFVPHLKLWLGTNNRPRVDGGDAAIWARIRLIPFNVSFKGREDKALPDTLRAELPGILAWAVRGCLAWQQDGLGTAEAVDAATRDYRKDEDILGAFLEERCEIDPGGAAVAAELGQTYEDFCKDVGETPMSRNVLGRELADRGIRRGGAGRRSYTGVRLLSQVDR